VGWPARYLVTSTLYELAY